MSHEAMWSVAVAACLLWDGAALVGIRPYYHSFGNEIVGGPAGAGREFIGSHYDWGQDLIRLKRWCDAHSYAAPLALAYYGPMDPGIVGLPWVGLPAELIRVNGQDGGPPAEARRNRYFCAVSASFLAGLPGPMVEESRGSVEGYFRLPPHVDRARPYTRIGYSILVYRIDPPDRPQGEREAAQGRPPATVVGGG